MNRGDPKSTDKFLRLQNAYHVLSSSELRREYDVQLIRTRMRDSSWFTEEFDPPKQSRYRFVIVQHTTGGIIKHCPLSICLSVCLSHISL